MEKVTGFILTNEVKDFQSISTHFFCFVFDFRDVSLHLLLDVEDEEETLGNDATEDVSTETALSASLSLTIQLPQSMSPIINRFLFN